MSDDLPHLTHKQFGFLKSLVAGDNPSKAYRANYDAENMCDEAVWVEAHRLQAHPKIALWLKEVRKGQLMDTKVTLETHTKELMRLATECEKSGNYGAAVNATVKMGQANGLYVDRIEMNSTAGMKELLEQINELPQELKAPILAMAGLSESDIEGETRH